MFDCSVLSVASLEALIAASCEAWVSACWRTAPVCAPAVVDRLMTGGGRCAGAGQPALLHRQVGGGCVARALALAGALLTGREPAAELLLGRRRRRGLLLGWAQPRLLLLPVGGEGAGLL